MEIEDYLRQEGVTMTYMEAVVRQAEALERIANALEWFVAHTEKTGPQVRTFGFTSPTQPPQAWVQS